MKSGIQTTVRHRCLRPVLRKWIDLNQRLSHLRQSEGDAPWWYNERALVSIFAGAVWLAGGYAFEEYLARKIGKNNHEFTGRVDLEFGIASCEFKAEAQQCWPTGTAKRDQTEFIRRFMERAVEDIRQCPPGKGTRRLAMVFGVPYLANRLQKKMGDRIEWFIDQAGQIEADSTAWIFSDLRHLPTHGDWSYPGIIIWIKEVGK